MRKLNNQLIEFNNGFAMAIHTISVDQIEQKNIYEWLRSNVGRKSYSMEMSYRDAIILKNSIYNITIFGKVNIVNFKLSFL